MRDPPKRRRQMAYDAAIAIFKINEMKTIVFANHKGGCGKTTSTLNVADGLSREGFSVLVIDMDPQSNTTRMLIGLDGIQPTTNIKDVLLAKDGKEAIKTAIIYQTAIRNVHLIPSTLRLAAIENELLRVSTLRSPCTYLRKCLPAIEENYDFCLIDVPPALSTLTGNALFAANYVIVPFSAGDRYGFEGVTDLVAYIRDAQEQDVNPELSILGAVVLNFNTQEIAHAMTERAISDHFDVLGKIPRSAAIQKSSIEGKTVLQAERGSAAARAFVQLTRTLVEKTGAKLRRDTKKGSNLVSKKGKKGEARG